MTKYYFLGSIIPLGVLVARCMDPFCISGFAMKVNYSRVTDIKGKIGEQQMSMQHFLLLKQQMKKYFAVQKGKN